MHFADQSELLDSIGLPLFLGNSGHYHLLVMLLLLLLVVNLNIGHSLS